MTDPPGGQAEHPGVRWLLARSGPALAIGVVCALLLWGLEWCAEQLSRWAWETAPAALGLDPESGWWIVGTLTLTGVIVGLVIQFAPGHAGFDSATHELDAPILPPRALPGVALVTIAALAGGVSLGPESPILAINTAVVVALAARAAPFLGAPLAGLTTIAGTVGAMFGTPVAAALLLTGVLAAASMRGALWDRMFLPLAAAASGAATTSLLGGPSLAMQLPAYTDPQLLDIVAAAVIAVAAAAFGVAGAWAFPRVHRALHALRWPLVTATLGGALLGVLGVLGGPVTLFKGLDQSVELLADPGARTAWSLLGIALIKMAALLIAASAGFRGGRIFPAVFIGVAIGLAAVSIAPQTPVGLAIGSGVLGIPLAVGRDGWLALFLAAVVAADLALLPLLCLALLPAWLVVTRAPHFLVPRSPEPQSASPAPW